MGSTVYTKRFFLGVVQVGTNAPAFGPPAGFVWVITDVGSGQTSSAGSWISVRDVATGYGLIGVATTATIAYNHWTGRLAVPAGEQLTITAYVNAAGVVITGYEFPAS